MRLVLRRVRGARSLLLAAVVATLLATSFVVGLLAYGQEVVAAAARATVAAAPAQERSLLVRGSATAARPDLATKDAAWRAALAQGIGGRPVQISTAGYSGGRELTGPTGDAVGDVEGADGAVFANVMFLDDLAGHASLVQGVWARPGQPVTEATLPLAAAAVLQVSVGDQLPITDRRSGATTPVVVTGIWDATDPADPYWLLAPGVSSGVAPGSHAYGPIALDRTDFERDWTGIASVAWVVRPEMTGVGLAGLLELTDALPALADLPDQAGLADSGIMTTSMDRLSDRLVRADLVGRSALLTPVLLIVVLGAYALLLVATLLTEHRRGETALIRARGAGRLQIAGFGLREAILLVIPAVALAPPLVGLVLGAAGRLAIFTDISVHLGSRPTTGMWVIAAVTAVGCIAAIVAPSVRHSGTYIEELGARSRPGRFAFAQRVGVDLALVVLAVVAWFQLRQYASPLSGAGGALGIDPMLVAAPTIGVLAGAVLSLRLLPRLTRLVERWLDRRHHTALIFGMWQAGRRPHAGPVLLVSLAVAVSTLAWSMLSTAERSLVDQADFSVGADVRVVEANGFAPEPRGAQIAAQSGVTAVAPVYRGVLTLGAASTQTALLGIEPGLASDIVHYRADLAGATAFAQLGRARPELPIVPLPAEATRIRATVAIDARTFESSFFNPFAPTTEEPLVLDLTVSAVLLAGDGHLVRLPLGTMRTTEHSRQFEVDLPAGSGLSLVRFGVAIAGRANADIDWSLTAVQTGDSAGAWSDLAFTGERDWVITDVRGQPTLDEAVREDASGLHGSHHAERFSRSMSFWLLPESHEIADLPVLATAEALRALGVAVGQSAAGSVGGVPVNLRIVGEVAAVPGTNHSPSALIADLPTLGALLGRTQAAGAAIAEHWVAVDPDAQADVAAGLSSFGGVRVLDRVAAAQAAGQEPYGVGGRAALFAAGAGALLLALIGIAVDIRATARRRVGEFAVLQTLGAGSRVLARSVLTEQGFLAGLGVAVGLGVGVAVAATLAPLLILTPTADRPEPTPLLSVPWLPVLGTAGALFGVAMLISGLVAATLGRRLAVARLRIGDEV